MTFQLREDTIPPNSWIYIELYRIQTTPLTIGIHVDSLADPFGHHHPVDPHGSGVLLQRYM